MLLETTSDRGPCRCGQAVLDSSSSIFNMEKYGGGMNLMSLFQLFCVRRLLRQGISFCAAQLSLLCFATALLDSFPYRSLNNAC